MFLEVDGSDAAPTSMSPSVLLSLFNLGREMDLGEL
jgi:hypothetical protein